VLGGGDVNQVSKIEGFSEPDRVDGRISMADQKHSCYCCSRRQFIGGVAAGGLVSAAPAFGNRRASGASPVSKQDGAHITTTREGDPFDPDWVAACKERCYWEYDFDCCGGCRRMTSPVKRAICFGKCATLLAACYAACEAPRLIIISEIPEAQ
jgi:hypothetical protein